MLLATTVFLTALAVLVVITADYGRRHLSHPAGPATDEDPAVSRLPWVKIFLVASALYFALMYWASVTYNPAFSLHEISGRSSKKEIRRPFMPLLDSKIAAIAPDYFFGDVADETKENKTRSDVLLYEDGKLLGPPHTSLYEVAVLGMGRYAHWKGNYSIFAFSSSDNTDPNTNGRTYWAERPRSK